MIIGKTTTITVVLIMIVALVAVPASADTVATNVVIQSGGGDPPWLMAVWQQDTTDALEDGDPDHMIPGPQFMPPVKFRGNKKICYFAVVFDAQGPDTITQVSHQVYNPMGNVQQLDGYSTGSGWFQWDQRYRYQVIGSNYYEVNDEDDKTAARETLQAAYLAGLVTFNDATWEEVDYMLSQDEAKLFWGCADNYYNYPAGWFKVMTTAFDHNNNPSDPVVSTYYNVPVAAFELDFNAIDYGDIALNYWKPISGDITFGTSDRPTARNIGNTYLKIAIEQNDMSIGTSLVNGVDRWDVKYGARLGDNSDDWREYEPYEEVVLPNHLPLCNTRKLDFKIQVLKAWSGSTYNGTMTLTAEPWWGD